MLLQSIILSAKGNEMNSNILSDTTLTQVAERVIHLVGMDDQLRASASGLLRTWNGELPSSNSSEPPADVEELELLERRCRMKADGCRWAAERMRLLNEQADFRREIAPLDWAIHEQAKVIPDCRLWMNCSEAPVPTTPEDYEVVGDCFEALAEAISIVRDVLTDLSGQKSFLAVAMQLVAESQSALRAAVQQIGGPNDHDQIAAYAWLRATTSARRILIERYMVADDQADAGNWHDLLARIESFRLSIVQVRRRERVKQTLLDRLSPLSDRLMCCDESERRLLWKDAVRATDELISLGVPPSDRQLRDVLLPVIDDAPEMECGAQALRLVQREIDRVRDRSTSATNGRKIAGTSEVQDAARLLSGMSVTLIGGDCRPERKQALEKAFDLKELVWIETTPGQSVNSFAPFVARPEVALVLLAIRWASHSYGGVRRFCDRYHKPLVWLPAGYSPNQVATQVLAQCSDRLSGANERR
jgi:hypothetical protein